MSDTPIAAPTAPITTPVDNVAPVEPGTDIVEAVETELDGETPAVVDEKSAKPQTKAEKKAEAAKKKYKLKVDGKDEDVEFDPSNEEEVIKQLQLAKVSHKRMQESAEMRKGIQELLDTLRTDPLKVLTDPRLQISEETRKKLAEAMINNELEEMAKTPEQREKERLQKEYERLKKQVEDEQKSRQELEFKMAQEKAAVELDQEMTEAIEASGLPKNARTVRYMAEALMFCLENNIDLTAKDLVPYVKKQTLAEFKEIIGSLPDDEFEGWVGKDRLSSLRKRSIAKAKVPQDPTAIKPTGAEVKKEEPEAKKIPMKSFFGALGK